MLFSTLLARGNTGATPPHKFFIKISLSVINNLLVSFIKSRHNTKLWDAIITVKKAKQNVQEVEFVGTIKNKKSAPINKPFLIKKRISQLFYYVFILNHWYTFAEIY